MTGRDADVLPQTVHGPYLTDGGLETSIVFQQGVDLVDFAAFPLLDTDEGRAALRTYYEPYLDLAEVLGVRHRPRHPDVAGERRLGSPPGLRRRAMVDVSRRAIDFVRNIASGAPNR